MPAGSLPGGRGLLLVAGQRHEGHDVEDLLLTPYSLDSPFPGASALHAFGALVPAQVRDAHLQVLLPAAPVFVEAAV